MDALFEAIDLVAGRMVYLMSLRTNESSRVTFDIEHSMTVEIVSEYLEGNNLQVRFFCIDYCVTFLFDFTQEFRACNITLILTISFQKKVFLDRHVALSHHAYNNTGPFPSKDNDKSDAEVNDDWKIDENQSDDSINDNIEEEKNNGDRKSYTKKLLAASITYKDEDIIRAIGGPSLR